jgi:hypothetical protein
MATSTILSTFKLVAAKRPSERSTLQIRRDTLVARICEQINIAEASAEGKSHAKAYTKRLRDKFSGEYFEVKKVRYPKPWWFISETGKVCLTVKYGVRALEFAKGKTAIEVGATADLIPALEKLKAATVAGELDSVLESIVIPLRRLK